MKRAERLDAARLVLIRNKVANPTPEQIEQVGTFCWLYEHFPTLELRWNVDPFKILVRTKKPHNPPPQG